MATEAQISANRDNAKYSTGPKTEEGKARSARNAEKHGLTAHWTTIAGELNDDFTDLLASYADRFNPQGEFEADLVRQLAVTQFRLGRAARLETSLLCDAINDASARWRKGHEGDPNDDGNLPFVIGDAVRHDARDEDTLSKVSRYELRLTHLYSRTLSRLSWLQDQRTKSTATPSEP